MGLSSSSMVSSSSSSSSSSRTSSRFGGSRLKRTRRILSSLLCGAASTSESTFQLEDYSQESPASSAKHLGPNDVSQHPIVESSPIYSSEVGDTSSTIETGESSGSDNNIVQEALVECQLNVKGSRNLAHLISNMEPASHQLGTDSSSSLAPANLHSDSAVEYLQNEVLGDSNSDIQSNVASDSLPPSQLPEDENAHMTATSSPGYFVSDNDWDLSSGYLLHLDVVNISSNFLSRSIAERNRLEEDRVDRRLFWDALSRRRDSRTMFLSPGHAGILGSHDRRFLDIGGINNDGVGHDIDSFSARRRRRNESRWSLRSEISERIGGLNGGARQTTPCASGLHHEGTCSCEPVFTSEESSTLASISRIVMLAEALFEVLDEIQRQSLSLLPSMLSLPAPESVVDAFPLEYYEKQKDIESDTSDAQQCYICLADYEERDELRVLPCNHKYHVACIDKWLKEINRVCPLCRRNVCEDAGECSSSNTELLS